MSDIVERLRDTHPNFDEKPMCNEAADEIERLRARLAEVEKNAIARETRALLQAQDWRSRAERLAATLSDLHSLVGVMVGRVAECVIPETIDTPIGVPVKIGQIMRDAKAALDAPAPSHCSDCPPNGYPTDKTRCDVCPRKSALAAAPNKGARDE